jgi:hypothetical protein
MIVFNLSCGNHHRFEGWFESAANFESQQQSRLLSCPVCGTDEVNKELHAPYVNTGAGRPAPNKPESERQGRQQAVFRQSIAQLVEHVLANTEDVGEAFPEEARKIHYREAPERAIRGNATPEELSDLQEEGIEVLAVPVPKYRLGKPH